MVTEQFFNFTSLKDINLAFSIRVEPFHPQLYLTPW